MDRGSTSDSERRQRILRATERLFHRYGPSKTTMADIAREAEIAVGTVYLEFASKDEILSELSTDQHHTILSAMRTAAAQASRPYRDRVRAVLDARVTLFLDLASAGAHACDLLHCQSRPVQQARACFLEEERALLAELLQSGARAGELDILDPDLVARALLRAYASFSPPWIFSQPRPEVEAMLRAVHDLVLYGLVRRPPAAAAPPP